MVGLLSSANSTTLEISERVIADLDRRIIDAVYSLEDALEFDISSQLRESPGDNHESYPLTIALDLQKLDQEIDFFTTTLSKIKEDYSTQIILELSDSDVEYDVSSRRIDFGRLVMMAYDALVSFMRLLDFFLDPSEVLIVPPGPQIELVYKDLVSLKVLVERNSSCDPSINRKSQKVIANLDSQIRKTTYELKNVLDIYKGNYISFWSHDVGKYIIDLQKVEQEIEFSDSVISKIKEDYNTQVLELSKSLGEDNENSRIDFGRSSKNERSEMAYAALISLMNKIEDLYYSKSSTVPRCPKIEFVYKDIGSVLLLEKSSKRS
ncbi:hypothetical protein BUALT_Bualt11G0069500 [Buddleja alternifolia]|uniref:Uncharacterized protein n=1 Tax=Buddleja alternifolia TaxID=168488 RepID=A0AAV6WUG1_9LAMI|nr:hypothetical protein BUALT_Bualt11G0069500 [Buddleja alternifolia]